MRAKFPFLHNILDTLQPSKVRDEYGIDYEKIKGDFIQRSDDEPLVSGLKNFEINIEDIKSIK